MLIKEDPKLFDWLDNKFRERKCNNCPRNKTIMFGNKKKQTCGGTSQVEIFNSGKEGAKSCIALIKMLNEL